MLKNDDCIFMLSLRCCHSIAKAESDTCENCEYAQLRQKPSNVVELFPKEEK